MPPRSAPAANRTGAAHRPAQPADGAGRTASAAVERADRSAGRSTGQVLGRCAAGARRASSYLRSLLFTVRPASVWPGNRRSTPSGKRSSPGCNTSWRTRVSNSNSTRRSCRKWSGSRAGETHRQSGSGARPVTERRTLPAVRLHQPPGGGAISSSAAFGDGTTRLRCAPSPRNCKPEGTELRTRCEGLQGNSNASSRLSRRMSSSWLPNSSSGSSSAHRWHSTLPRRRASNSAHG